MEFSKTEPKIKLPKSWFDDEERWGFTVKTEVKRSWIAQLEVLCVIDEICRKHDITYFADWGTMLGSIRHKGFIPWDDDMDICMKRADYTKFRKVVEKELPEGFCFINTQTETGFGELLSRVVNSKSVSLEPERLQRFHGCPYVVGIDIFPLDFLPTDKDDEQIIVELFKIIFTAIHLHKNIITSIENQVYDEVTGDLIKNAEAELENILVNIEDFLNVNIDRAGDIQKQLYNLVDNVGALYMEDECEYLTSMANFASGWGGGTYLMKKEWYEKPVYVDFEGIFKMPVPCGYLEILPILYHDYMTPVTTWGTHDYPFFNPQKDMVKSFLLERGLTEDNWEEWLENHINNAMSGREYW